MHRFFICEFCSDLSSIILSSSCTYPNAPKMHPVLALRTVIFCNNLNPGRNFVIIFLGSRINLLCLKITRTLCVTIGWQLQKTILLLTAFLHHLWKCNVDILRICTCLRNSRTFVCIIMVYKIMLKDPTIWIYITI